MKSGVAFGLVVLVPVLVLAACGEPQTTEDPCEGFSCGDHGACAVQAGGPICICEAGYTTGSGCEACALGYVEDAAGDCVPEEAASCPEPDPCAPGGACGIVDDAPACSCDPGYVPDGLSCVAEHVDCPVADPCEPHGHCDDLGGAPVCVCDAGYAADGLSCAPEQTASCEDYGFDQVSYVHQLTIPDASGEPCCADFTGDGVPDNSLGQKIVSFGGLVGVSADAALAESIDSGALCLLLEYHGLADPANGGPFPLAVLRCADDDGDASDNKSGVEPFSVRRDSFVHVDAVCTDTPASLFPQSTVEGGSLAGEDGYVAAIELPFAGFPLRAELYLARIEAELQETAGGLQAVSGKLGGAVPVRNVVQSFNDDFAATCPCADSPELVTYAPEPGVLMGCNTPDVSACEGEAADECGQRVDYCPVSVRVLGAADADVDGDGVNDAWSLGLRFETVSAAPAGLAAE